MIIAFVVAGLWVLIMCASAFSDYRKNPKQFSFYVAHDTGLGEKETDAKENSS